MFLLIVQMIRVYYIFTVRDKMGLSQCSLYSLETSNRENATGHGINLYNYQKLLNPTGMNGIFLYSGYNNILCSTSRSMAQFGLLILNNGKWDGNQIIVLIILIRCYILLKYLMNLTVTYGG